MTPQRKTWQYVPAKPKPTQVPSRLKAEVEGKAQQLIDEVLKPKHLKPPPADETFNYIADIYGRWYRHYYYFCSRYNSPGPNAIAPFFEDKFARMEYAGDERFHLDSCVTPTNGLRFSVTCRSTNALRQSAAIPYFIPNGAH